MTTHRIPADKVVIEDDRRQDFVSWKTEYKRGTPHDYSQPHKIIYVPVGPQPFRHDTPVDSYWVLDDDAEDVIHETELEDTLLDKSPFHPDDTLIIGDDKYNVVKVLGVEEKMMSPDPMADGMWHWILLGVLK